MNIETNLPENFEELEDSEKVEELRKLLEEFDEETDEGVLKKRMVEELIREYSS